MQPCSREMQAMNSMMNQSQVSLPDIQNGQQHHHQIANPQIHHFDTVSSHEDFLDQMLSSLPSCSWPDLADANPKSPWDLSSNPEAAEAGIGSNISLEVVSSDDQGPSNLENVSQHQFDFEHDQPAVLASKLRQYQISGAANSAAAAKTLLLQQQLQLQSTGFGGGGLRSPTGGSGMFHGNGDDVVDASSFKSPNSGIDGSVQALYNGFVGSLHGNDQTPNQGQHFQYPQAHNFGAAATGAMNQGPAASGSAGGGVTAQPKQQRVRARRGQATDPHSIAERLRRERIAERMKALQELVPNANKTDKASMLDEIIDYVKFLQLQVKVLSMSRLGGAAAVAPLVADRSSEGGGDCIQASVGGARGGNGTAAAASTSNNNDNLTVTEHQVAKLMEEDMGSAMQYLQGKGLCLMPISLATAISTATSHSRNLMATNPNPLLAANGAEGGCGGPSSPSLSVLTVQSGAVGNGGADISGKDAVSVSKP